MPGCCGSLWGAGGRKRRETVRLHTPYFGRSQMRTDRPTLFRGLMRARSLLTADLLASKRPREGGPFPQSSEPSPRL